VQGLLDSTPLLWHVAVQNGSYLQLDDIVVTARDVPGQGLVTTSGIVTEVSARHEGASFGSDVFLISDGVLPAAVQEVAEVTTTRVEPEFYVPPSPGEIVRRAAGDERAQALYFDQMDRKVAVGAGRDGATVYVNMDFIDGSRGAHVSISGISGVATKTSFALFLLHAMFRGDALRDPHNAKALIFSVKGEDLLFLNRPNRRLADPDGDALRGSYARLGLPAEPFTSVAFYAPPTPGDRTGRPHLTGRTTGVTAFWWTLPGSCSRTCSPTPRTIGSSTRWLSTMSPAVWPGKATEADLNLVMINGVARVGTPALMKKLGPLDQQLTVGGRRRAVNLQQATADASVAAISVNEAIDRLKAALKALPEVGHAVGRRATRTIAMSTDPRHSLLAVSGVIDNHMSPRPHLPLRGKLTGPNLPAAEPVGPQRLAAPADGFPGPRP
jgi:hypothetical protein